MRAGSAALERTDPVRGPGVKRPQRRQADHVEPARGGGQRFDRALQQDLQQPVELQLGGERVAEPAHRRLQPGSFLLDELQTAVRLLDAPVAVAGQQPQQDRERYDEQHRAETMLGGDSREESQRREARVDRPHRKHDPQLDRAVRHSPDEPHAHKRTDKVQQAARHERGHQQGQRVEAERRRAGGHQHEGGPERVPALPS